MAVKRLEVSNPKYTADNTQLLTLHSSHLNRRHDVSIYNVNAQKKDAPIIILLHGVYGNHWAWMHLGGLHIAYDNWAKNNHSEFVVVMPSDGGFDEGSGYLPTVKNGNYDQWIMDDVINSVIKTVDNVSEKSPVYISGLSMGGYGALRLGSKYADKISGISAHSSITDINELSLFTETSIDEYTCAESNEASISHWLTTNKESLPPIRFDCGQDDVLYKGNLKFAETLKHLGIQFKFESFTGEHSWDYWHEHVLKTFDFFAQIEQEK